MVFGTLVCYFSIAIFTGSFLPVLAVLLFALFLLTYIKLVEEKEMSLRFGDEYTRYKQSAPFLIPNLFKKKPKT